MRQSAWSSLVDGVEAEAFFGVDFPWGEGNRGGGYLLIAGDLLLALSGDFAAAAAAAAVGLFLLYSSRVLLSRYYALNREREREQTHRSV